MTVPKRTLSTRVRDFLRIVFSSAPEHALIWIAILRKPPTPDAPEWKGRPYSVSGSFPNICDANAYFSISAFPKDATNRRKANALGATVLLLDDIGSKVKTQRVLKFLGPPTYILQTSSQSQQWGYVFTRLASIEEVERLHRALETHKLTDQDGANAVRYGRLPGGINSKPEHVTTFKVRLKSLHRERQFQPEDLATKLGVDVISVRATDDSKSPFDVEGKIASILRAEHYHDQLRDLAAHYAGKRLPPNEIIEILQGFMQAVKERGRRWQARFDDIPRAVRTAVDKFGTDLKFNWRDHRQDVDALLATPPKPIDYLVPGLLARGATSLFFGPPKGFKTTLATQFALALTKHSETLGQGWDPFGPITGGHRVAILDLEQSEQLFVERLRSSFGITTAPGFLRFSQWPVFDDKGLKALEDLILSEGLSAVFVDSLTRIRPPRSAGTNAFDLDTATLQPVTDLAHRTHTHISVIGHAGKRREYDEPLQMVAGTSGLLAAVDDVLVLFKHPEDEDTPNRIRRRLYVTGRHIRHWGGYVIENSGKGFHIICTDEKMLRTALEADILAVLRNSLEGLTPTQITLALSRPKDKRSLIYKALSSMKKRQLVVAEKEERWRTVENAIANARERRAKR